MRVEYAYERLRAALVAVATREGLLSPRLRVADDQLEDLEVADFPPALQPTFAALTALWSDLLRRRMGREARVQQAREVVTALLTLYDEHVCLARQAAATPPAHGGTAR